MNYRPLKFYFKHEAENYGLVCLESHRSFYRWLLGVPRTYVLLETIAFCDCGNNLIGVFTPKTTLCKGTFCPYCAPKELLF